jgi:hypothetical protein
MTKEERDRLLLIELSPGFKWPTWRAMPKWCRFGLMWNEAQKKEWWPDFWEWVYEKEFNKYAIRTQGQNMSQDYFWGKIFTGDYGEENSLIHLDRLADALAEFLGGKKSI